MKDAFKVVLLFISISVFTVSVSYAQGSGQGIHIPGTGISNPAMKQQGSGQGVTTTPVLTTASQSGAQIQQPDRDRLLLYLQDQDRIMQQDRLKMQEQDRLIYQNQDSVLLGAMFLREVQKTIPNVNPKLAQFGQELQQSTQVTVQDEQRLRSRSHIMTFLFGSDQQAAIQLEQTATQNKDRLRQVTQLVQQCSCDAQVKNMIQQQVTLMNQEQERLLQVAAQEKTKKGFFHLGS